MAESSSDLESPLLISKQPQEQRPLQPQKSRDAAGWKWKGQSPGLERRRSGLEGMRSGLEGMRSGLEGMRSGKWQFQNQKFSQIDDFAEKDGLTEGKREYNRKQRETLAGFQEVDEINRRVDLISPEVTEESCQKDCSESLAISLSNGMNVFLLIVKIYASVKSGSLAIVASTLDSLLDLLAGLVLFFAHYYMQRRNLYQYPIGKLRIQPVGIVVFAAIMATLGLQVLITGVEQLLEGAKRPMDDGQRLWLIIIMGSATLIKLALYMYCRTFDNEIVNVYAMDHFFDVVTNIVGLAAALLGDYFYWWIDPAGAIFLALYTIVNWGKTVLENAASLVGKAAPTQVLQKLTYMALNHNSQIQRIDTVRAYTFGSFYFVEVDIELPEDMPLKDAHEIGESLQNKLECLPEVERAFVHLDYECAHRPEHFATEFKY